MTPALARYYALAAFICALFMFLLSEPQEYLWQDFLHAYYAAGRRRSVVPRTWCACSPAASMDS